MKLNHTDLGPKVRVNRAHFKPDIPAPDDQHCFWNIGQIQSTGRIHHAIRSNVERTGKSRNTAGCDNRVIKRKLFLGWNRRIVSFQNQRIGILKFCERFDHGHIPFAGQTIETTRQIVNDFFFSSSQLVDFDVRFSKTYTPVALHLFGFRDNASNMQQSFGRYASSEQTGSAKPSFGFDDGNLHAFVRCQKCRSVSAGTSTNHNQLSLHNDFQKNSVVTVCAI